MVVLTILFRPLLNGQCSPPPDCITNSGFNPSAGGPPLPGYGMPIGISLPDWAVFSGTPVYAEGNAGTHGARLNNGDGIYACYNFRSGLQYKVCFLGYNPDPSTNGSIVLEAYDGSTAQQIANISFYNYNTSSTSPKNMVSGTATFTATSNFNQLRFSIPNLGNSYAVVIDDVGVIEVPVLTATQSTINACGSATLRARSTNLLSYTWSPNANLNTTVGSNVIAKPCSTTTYTLNYSSSCPHYTCSSGSKTITLNVNQNLSISASQTTINTCGSSVLTANSTNPINVTWSPSTGLSSTSGSTVIARPCKTTTYIATFACPQTNCSYTRNITIYVNKNGSIVNNTAKPCGSTIDLEHVANPPCPGMTYAWYSMSAPSTVLSTSSKYIKPLSSPSDQGVYFVIVKTPQGCIDTLYTTVVMDCCNISVDFEPVDCNPVRFINNTIDGITGDPIILGEWHWDFGDGTTSNIRNPSHLYRNSWGPTTICLTAVVEQNNSTCCAKVCKVVDVCDFGCIPKAAFDYSLVTPGTTDVQFTDRSVGGGTPCGYEWYVNGVLMSTAASPMITLGTPLPPGPGNRYNICMKVWYCPDPNNTCFEEWCEVIEIP